MHFAASLTPVSAHFLRQESIPSDYLRQATCVTLGVVLKFDAAHDFCCKTQNASILYEDAFCLPVFLALWLCACDCAFVTLICVQLKILSEFQILELGDNWSERKCNNKILHPGWRHAGSDHRQVVGEPG